MSSKDKADKTSPKQSNDHSDNAVFGRKRRRINQSKSLTNLNIKERQRNGIKNGPAKKRKDSDYIDCEYYKSNKKRSTNADVDGNLEAIHFDEHVKPSDIYQAFEKPIKIYEYLSLRHRYHPVFLNRTLSYLNIYRKPSQPKSRTKPKIDAICSQLASKQQNMGQQQFLSPTKSQFLQPFPQQQQQQPAPSIQAIKELTISFLSFDLNRNEDTKKKRKSRNSIFENEKAIIELYALSNGYNSDSCLLGKCYVNVINTSAIEEQLGSSVNSKKNSDLMKICLNGHSNNETSKLLVILNYSNSKYKTVFNFNLNEIIADSSSAVYSLRMQNGTDDDEGEFDEKSRSIEALKNNFHFSNPFIKFQIEIKLQVQQKPLQHNTRNGGKQRGRQNDTTISISSNSSSNSSLVFLTPTCTPRKIQPNLSNSGSKFRSSSNGHNGHTPNGHSSDVKITYQFVYNSKLSSSNMKLPKIQSFTYEPFKCPFCYLNCMQFNALLKHFTFVHFRFHMESNPSNISKASNKQIHIHVSLNDLFNGSYMGNQYDLHSPYGYSYSRLKPHKRIPITYIYVCKKSNFLYSNDLNDLNGSNQMQFNNLYNINSLEKLYYHARTCLPLKPDELLEDNCCDSDDDIDPEWIKEQTAMFIHEFTDVNQGEKELMRLWNLHVMNNIFISDTQVFHACETFLSLYAQYLIDNSLCRNFLLHLANLYDYGLLKPSNIIKLSDSLYAKVKTKLE